MDVLSQALRAVHTTSAIFFRVECTAPWGFDVPSVDTVIDRLSPGTERLVAYHLMLEGDATVELGDDVHSLRAGDIVVLPHGDAHRVYHGDPPTIAASEPPLVNALGGAPETIRLGNGGARTTIICGFFGCDRLADGLFLAGLPKLFTIDLRSDESGSWLESSVRHLVDDAQAQRPGSAALLSSMAEALFIDALRRYYDALPDQQRGWLAALRDPIVGRALNELHADPSRAWTVDSLASTVGSSRSVLAERFAHYLGDSPVAYLTRWRLQLGARLLQTSTLSVLEIALDVGYKSESTFNRAFKRAYGIAPGRYRRTKRAS